MKYSRVTYNVYSWSFIYGHEKWQMPHANIIITGFSVNNTGSRCISSWESYNDRLSRINCVWQIPRMPSNVVHVSGSTYISVVYTVAYPIFLLSLDNGAFLQSDVQSCIVIIRNNNVSRCPEKKTWILITQAYHTAKLLPVQILKWRR